MNKQFLFSFFAVVLCLSLVSFTSAESNACSLNVSLVNQDPYPAVPGEYVDVVFQVSGLQNDQCDGAMFQLVPSYPFSLDDAQDTFSLQGSTWVANTKNEWLIPYKLRVDADAVEGDNQVQVKYGENSLMLSKYFDISIEDSQTTFDAVVQDVSGTEISIAIANVGKYTANSVIVKVPDQEGVRTIGTNGQMVGNLEDGDYTIVSFNVAQKTTGETQAPSAKTQLTIEVDYTDAIGKRRVVEMPIAFDFASFSVMSEGQDPYAGKRATQSSSWYSSGMFWVLLLVGLFVLYSLYRKYNVRLLELWQNRKFLKKKKYAVPEWAVEAPKTGKKKI